MLTDAVYVRLDTDRLRDAVAVRPELFGRDPDPIVDALVRVFQARVEALARDLEDGRGDFEICLFEAL